MTMPPESDRQLTPRQRWEPESPEQHAARVRVIAERRQRLNERRRRQYRARVESQRRNSGAAS